MRDKIHFKRDVAQAVMGDVRESLSLSNTVTLRMGSQWGVILMLACLCIWLLSIIPASAESSQNANPPECYFEGEAYSIGSTMRSVTDNWQECVLDDVTKYPKWIKRTPESRQLRTLLPTFPPE